MPGNSVSCECVLAREPGKGEGEEGRGKERGGQGGKDGNSWHLAAERASTNHSDIREFIHQTPQHAHLTVQVLRPHIADLGFRRGLWYGSPIEAETLYHARADVDGSADEASRDITRVSVDETKEVLLLLEVALLCGLGLLLGLLLDLLLELLITALDGCCGCGLGLGVVDLLLLGVPRRC